MFMTYIHIKFTRLNSVVNDIKLKPKYMVCPKSNENDFFFCTAQKGQERKMVIEAGGGGTQV